MKYYSQYLLLSINELNPGALFIHKHVFIFWQVKGPMDNSHFDVFPPDTEKTPDELSGWDKDF